MKYKFYKQRGERRREEKVRRGRCSNLTVYKMAALPSLSRLRYPSDRCNSVVIGEEKLLQKVYPTQLTNTN